MKRLRTLVLERMEERWSGFLTKSKRFAEDLEQQLSVMRATYGDEAVDILLKRDLNGTAEPFRSIGKKSHGGQTKVSKKRRRSSTLLSYGELRPHVIEAVKTLEGDFTRKEIETDLEKRGLKFSGNHIILILARNVSGVERAGSKTRAGKGGPPLSVFRKTGDPVGLIMK